MTKKNHPSYGFLSSGETAPSQHPGLVISYRTSKTIPISSAAMFSGFGTGKAVKGSLNSPVQVASYSDSPSIFLG